MEDKDTGLHVTEGVISIGGDELTEEQQNVLEQVDRESKTRKFLGVLQKVFLAACFLIALYHLYTAAFGPPLTLKHRSLHVAMMLSLAFALYPVGKVKNMKKIPWYDWILIALAFAAAGLSGGDPMKTGFTAVKLALTGFLIPFMFVYCPQLLLIDVGLAEGIWVSFAAVVGVFMLAISIEGYWLRPMPMWLRIPCFVGALFLIHSDWKTDIVGFAVLVVVIFTVLMRNKEKKAAAA